MTAPLAHIVTIHQPSFLPWIGFFDKMARADTLVILDDAQMPKKGGTWTNRVQFLKNGKPGWLTVPIDRSYHDTRLINEIEIRHAVPWAGKMIDTIRQNYSHAPFFADVYPALETLLADPPPSLLAFNLRILNGLFGMMNFDSSRLVLSSSLGISETATDRLIQLTQAVAGTAYLSGDGAGGYLEPEKFAAAGIELLYQNFEHPAYPQINRETFVAGLSIVDVLMNCGPEATRKLISIPVSSA